MTVDPSMDVEPVPPTARNRARTPGLDALRRTWRVRRIGYGLALAEALTGVAGNVAANQILNNGKWSWRWLLVIPIITLITVAITERRARRVGGVVNPDTASQDAVSVRPALPPSYLRNRRAVIVLALASAIMVTATADGPLVEFGPSAHSSSGADANIESRDIDLLAGSVDAMWRASTRRSIDYDSSPTTDESGIL